MGRKLDRLGEIEILCWKVEVADSFVSKSMRISFNNSKVPHNSLTLAILRDRDSLNHPQDNLHFSREFLAIPKVH